MKRLILILLLFPLFLCGCAKSYFEPEQIIIISSIGIDADEDGILLTLETVDTSKPEGNWEYSPKTLEISNISCAEAYSLLQKSLGNKLNLEHCVLVAFGESLQKNQILNNLVFLSQTKKLSQNTKVIRCQNANALIKTRSFSGQAVGYDIVKILALQSDKKTNLKSNLYNVLKSSNGVDLQLPEISLENGKYFLKGATK